MTMAFWTGNLRHLINVQTFICSDWQEVVFLAHRYRRMCQDMLLQPLQWSFENRRMYVTRDLFHCSLVSMIVCCSHFLDYDLATTFSKGS